ncbi:PDR/VanB family oxidoreductase [Streptomyces sp. NPDC056255]|uniref:PDR/VanB family oxidoreductase n=1 Tax=Streptomyces sp. NPDC056255 TaxID=3345764 RepID=UPI0035E1FAB6
MTEVCEVTAPAGTRVLEVREAGAAADGVLSLTLTDPSGAPLPPWTPGAHVDLHVAPGLVRQYSLCSDPEDTGHYRIAVLRVPDGRGGSAAVHETLRAGSRVAVSAPRNHFELVDAPEYVLVAGGIGITPLLAMAHRLTASGKPWRMLYGGRSRTTMAFLGELPPDRVTVVPQDEAGHPDLAGYLAATPGATVYACGPGGLLDAVRELHPGPVHTERFTAPDPARSPDGDHAFDVRLARSGIDVHVPADTSVLDAVRAAGAETPSSCEAGICGTCETAVLDGFPDHRDTLLTPQEQEAGATMLICVSRCRGARLVLDL